MRKAVAVSLFSTLALAVLAERPLWGDSGPSIAIRERLLMADFVEKLGGSATRIPSVAFLMD
jgi:hypothetical protein